MLFEMLSTTIGQLRTGLRSQKRRNGRRLLNKCTVCDIYMLAYVCLELVDTTTFT